MYNEDLYLFIIIITQVKEEVFESLPVDRRLTSNFFKLSLANLMCSFQHNFQLISISLISCHLLLIKALNEMTNAT